MTAVTQSNSSLAGAIACLNRGDVAAALAHAEAVLAEQGDSAKLRHLLGVACCRLGKLDAGIDHLERAAQLAPDDPAILMMLMRAMIDDGRPRDALTRPFDAAGLPPPALLGLWRTRAEAAHHAGDAPIEADALERAVLLDPGDHRAREHLVGLLLSLDRPARALSHLEELPPSKLRERARSTALSALLRLDEAADIDHRLLGEDPQDREAWLSLVMLGDRQGNLARLVSMLDWGEQHGYDHDENNFTRALIAKLEGRTDDALALAKSSTVPSDPARSFALVASLADRLGQADEAFAAATSKARLTAGYENWRQRGAVHRENLRRISGEITPEWAARWMAAPPMVRPAPTFLVGFPRSGTTLLDTFLMGHPDVVVIEEEPMLDAAAQAIGDLARLDRADAPLIEQARGAYFAELDRHLPSGSKSASLVIDKLPLAMTGASLIHRLFPDAKFIFARRHPADAVLSNYLQAFRMNDAMANFLDLEDAAQFYDTAMHLWTRTCDVLPLEVRPLTYENLVEDPFAALRPLVEWLGLKWDDALLDHRRTAAARGVIVTPSYDQVIQPIHRRSSGRWQHYAHHLAPILALLDPWARHLGYEPILPRA